jgi:hypothetical protein
MPCSNSFINPKYHRGYKQLLCPWQRFHWAHIFQWLQFRHREFILWIFFTYFQSTSAEKVLRLMIWTMVMSRKLHQSATSLSF